MGLRGCPPELSISGAAAPLLLPLLLEQKNLYLSTRAIKRLALCTFPVAAAAEEEEQPNFSGRMPVPRKLRVRIRCASLPGV